MNDDEPTTPPPPADIQVIDDSCHHKLHIAADGIDDQELQYVSGCGVADESPASPVDSVSPVIHYASTKSVCANIFKAFVGSGIFMFPTYMKDGGWLLGPILAIAFAMVNVDAIQIHVIVQRRIGKPHVSTFSEVVGFVLGPRCQSIVSGSITFMCLMFAVVYVQISAGIIAEIFSWKPMYALVIAASAGMTFPSSALSNDLGKLGYISMFSTVCVGVLFVVTFIYIAVDFGEQGGSDTATPFGHGGSSIFMFAASMMTSFMAIPPMLPIYNSMPHEGRADKFKTLLRGTALVVTAVYVVYGTIGYVTYGESLDVSVISLLPRNWFGDSMRFLLALNLMSTIPINVIPAAQELDAAFHVARGANIMKNRTAVTIRGGLTLFVCLTAMILGTETVTLVVDYLGATICVWLSAAVPAILQLHVEHAVKDESGSRETLAYHRLLFTRTGITFIKARCWFYVFLSVILTVFGLTICIQRSLEIMEARNAAPK